MLFRSRVPVKGTLAGSWSARLKRNTKDRAEQEHYNEGCDKHDRNPGDDIKAEFIDMVSH